MAKSTAQALLRACHLNTCARVQATTSVAWTVCRAVQARALSGQNA
jgi:hypothetical protein